MGSSTVVSRSRYWLATLLLVVAGVLGSATSPARAGANDPVGISPGGDLLWLSDADLARELDLYKATGMTWVRVDFDWPSIESVKGTFNWSTTDRVVTAAASRGLKVLALPTYSPSWATSVPGNSHAGPTNVADFGNFLTKAVQRYASQGVKVWEIWNEPNLTNFWAPRPNPAAYTALLKTAYLSVKAADASATVIAGALSPATDPADGSQISPATFTTKIYANGARGYFDAMSVHPYCYPAMPNDTTTASWNTFQRLPLVHDVMTANGDGAKKIWLTEFGAPTGTGTDAVAEAKQADIITAGVTTAAAWDWTGPLFIYGGRDRGTDLANREENFGFVHSDFTSKPAHAALTAALGGTIPAPTPVTVTPAAPTSLRVSSLSSTSAIVKWTVAANSTVTGYQLQIRRNSGSWVTQSKVKSTTAAATLSGLTSRTKYSVRVALFNQAGTGSYSSSLTFTTPRTSYNTTASLTGRVSAAKGTATGMSRPA